MHLRTYGLIAFLSLWAAGVAWNALAFDYETARLKRWEPDVVALPQPEVAKLTSLGFDAFVADLYWVAAVQYFGNRKNHSVCYAELGNYIDLVNMLAPDFKSAYRFGGMAVPCNRGDKWVNIEAACAILERGLARFPDEWFLRLMLAYNYSAYLGRLKDAGDQLMLAVGKPGAPKYLASLATRLYATAGDLDGAALIAEKIRNEAADPAVRDAMERRIFEVETERRTQHLQAAINAYRAAQGRLPLSLEELVTAGVVTRIPVEPSGGQFVYDSATGEVKSSALRTRLHVTIDP